MDLAQRLCLQDPVRPNIPYNWRVDPPNKIVYYIENAVLCAAYCEDIPITEEELLNMNPGPVVVCYSVWSSQRGQGKKIVNLVIDKAKENPHTTRYVTLSPKTEMARKFHLNNGAILLQENETTNTFEYGGQLV